MLHYRCDHSVFRTGDPQPVGDQAAAMHELVFRMSLMEALQLSAGHAHEHMCGPSDGAFSTAQDEYDLHRQESGLHSS